MPEITRKLLKKLRGGVVELQPSASPRGRVLLSYTTLPFISPNALDGHTNRWECRRIAELFLEAGYAVDVVDFDHPTFTPHRTYNFCLDIAHNLERFTPSLGKGCVKVFHATTSHWLFNNQAEYTRLLELQKRRGFTLVPQRALTPSRNIEVADVVTLLGNDVTAGTYAYAQKSLRRIPISTTHLYPAPERKKIARAKTGFIWFGGSGIVHKGLDLVLETFTTLPDLHLTVFGKADTDFTHAYRKELQETANIQFLGHVDPGSRVFQNALETSIGLIFPSCAEGSSGGVVTAMHAGLIPIVSKEAGVDIGEAGIILPDCTVDTMRQVVTELTKLPEEQLNTLMLASWHKARAQHTRELFSAAYEHVIRELIS